MLQTFDYILKPAQVCPQTSKEVMDYSAKQKQEGAANS